MTYPPDPYSDLRDEMPTPEFAGIVALLDTLGRQFSQITMPTEKAQQTAALLRDQALVGQRLPSHTRQRGARWVRRVALPGVAALLTIVVLTGATLAFHGSIFPWNYSFLQQSGQLPGSQQVNIARTSCGYTLRLRSVYADANAFVVGYAVTSPNGKSVQAGLQGATVTDRDGTALPVSDYGGVTEGSGLVQYQSFDTGSIAGRPSELKLHMVVPSITLGSEASVPSVCHGQLTSTGPTRSSPPAVSPSPTPVSAGASAVAESGPGPFVFDLTVVDYGGRELRPDLAVTQYGRTLILERVVSTPLETRFYVRGSALNAYPILSTGGDTFSAGSWGPAASDNSLIIYDFSGSLYSEHGPWTLSIHTQDSIGTLPGEQPLPKGVWTFNFTLP